MLNQKRNSQVLFSINFSLPVYYTVERKKEKVVKYTTKKGITKTRMVKDTTHLIGLNWYRNANPFLLCKVKHHYHNLVISALQGTKTKILGKYSTEYKYYYRNDSSDAGNVISIVEKFMLDGLKEAGYTTDDSVMFNVKSNGWTVEQDKSNPRLEITIKDIKEL